MTREDANFILANIDRRVCDDELSEALDLAIKALSAEPCEDAISRHDAILLADELKDDLPDDERMADMVTAHNEGISEYQTKLSLLPPVTPNQTDALDKIRAEIKEQYGGCGLINDGLDMALSIIDKYLAESEGNE